MKAHQRFRYNQQYGEYNRKKENLNKEDFSQKHNFFKKKKKDDMLPVPISLVINKIKDRQTDREKESKCWEYRTQLILLSPTWNLKT